MNGPILTSLDDGAGTLTLNRPEARPCRRHRAPVPEVHRALSAHPRPCPAGPPASER